MFIYIYIYVYNVITRLIFSGLKFQIITRLTAWISLSNTWVMILFNLRRGGGGREGWQYGRPGGECCLWKEIWTKFTRLKVGNF